MKNYLSDFLNYLRVEKNSSDNTITAYRKDIEQFFDIAIVKSIDDISKYKIRSFLAHIVGEQLATATRKRKLASIRSFCDFLEKEGIINHNFAKDIDNPKTGKRLPKVINANDMNSVLDSISDIRDRAILEALYALGCRISELVHIKISDIDFENKTINVIGKGNKQRMIPINDTALRYIKKHINTRFGNNEYLFESNVKVGCNITDRAVRNIVKKYFGENIHPHMFRHSCATHLHENGVDIRIIQEILGHADISTTTIYTNVSNSRMSIAYHNAHLRG